VTYIYVPEFRTGFELATLR